MPELFAATALLEYIKYLISLRASSQWTSAPTRLMLSDNKKAYFYARAKRPVFVQLPDEDDLEGHCGKLQVSMYGTRDAAANLGSRVYTGAHRGRFQPRHCDTMPILQ